MEEQSCMTLSDFSPQQIPNHSFRLLTHLAKERFSQEDVYALALEKLYDMANKLENLERQYSLYLENPRRSQSRNCSKSTNEEYLDILNKKSNFIDGLTYAVGMSDSVGVPQYTLHISQELSSLLNDRCSEAYDEVRQKTAQITKLKSESLQLQKQISLFSNLAEELNETEETPIALQSRQLLHDAKQDLDTVMQTLYPEAEVRDEFVFAFNILIGAYLKNLNSEEDQFVELPLHCISNLGLLCLIKGCVVTRHPVKLEKFRLDV